MKIIRIKDIILWDFQQHLVRQNLGTGKICESSRRIIEKSGWDCILSGGQADSVLIEEVISNMKHAETVKNYAGCCSLAQTIHLLNAPAWQLETIQVLCIWL